MSGMQYERPDTAQQACALLAEGRGKAHVLAGGTDLLVHLRDGLIEPTLVVDIKGLPGVKDISWQPDGGLRIGAAVTMRRIYQEPRLAQSFVALAEGAQALGSLQVRSRATLGGNLCNASPCMDTAPPLVVLGAKLEILGPTGERTLPVERLFAGVKRNNLAPGEIVLSVLVPAEALTLRSGFDKIKRVRGHDLALVNAAVSYQPKTKVLRAAVGSCGATPVITPDLGHADPEQAPEEVADLLAQMAVERLSPIDDVRASARYRKEMAALLCRRLARRVLAGPQSSSVEVGS